MALVEAKSFKMSEHWGQLSPWTPSNFGIVPTNLPAGCAYKQIHVLQRHTERLPSDSADDAGVMVDFAAKVAHVKATPSQFQGALEFLNRWEYNLDTASLTARGAASSALLGAHFWAEYGRLLYKTPAQARYNASLVTSLVRPVFRTTNQERMYESARWYFAGFYSNVDAGSSSNLYDLVVIPEGGTENNTLAAYDSCPSFHLGNKSTSIGAIGTREKARFIAKYAKRAQKRLAKLLPVDFGLTVTDVFAMQNLCAYETAAFGRSDFCVIFREQDWRDYDYALGLSMYHNYGYGNPTGRAQGLGYVEELLARLEHRIIRSSSSSVNTTFDSTEASFGHFSQPLIFDGTHDAIIVSVLSAMGMKFFNGTMSSNLKKAPRNPKFRLGDSTPFGAKLHTEVISCPKNASFTWTPEALKYEQFSTYVQPEDHEDHVEYIRMKLNEGVLPVPTELGCTNAGAEMGFCTLSEFLRVLSNVEKNAQFEEVCFGTRVLQVQSPVGNGNLDYTGL